MNYPPLFIAILYTGQVRTLLKTIEAFHNNVIRPNIHHTIHIYTCLEHPESNNKTEIQQYKQEVEQLFHDQFQNHLISMTWISSKDPLCKFIREKTVENMPVSDLWKDYLCNRSGSITEYYQLYKGYEQIENYSNQHQIKYDFFIRTRCDIMIPQPFDLNTFQYSIDEITKRFQTIQQAFPYISNAHVIALYLTTIPQPLQHALSRISTPNFTLESFYNKKNMLCPMYERFLNPKHPENHLLTMDEIAKFILMILPCTMLTYRQNLFYMGFIKNGLVENDIVFNYKYFEENRNKYTYSYNEHERTIEGEQPYWFNAENIYQKVVIEKAKVIVNSYTEKEEKSLYNNVEEGSVFYLVRK